MALNQLGLRINTSFERVDPALVSALRKYPAAVIGDNVNRLQCFGAGFHAYGGRKAFAGPAFTVRVRPGDNLLVHKALDLAQAGDVVVVDAGGALNTAILGAMMATYAKSRGIEALVIDGAIRDVEELLLLDLAVVALGATPNGPFKSGPGEIGYPIACGGLSIAPGDLVLGDADGVLVAPRSEVAALIEPAEARVQAEAKGMREIAAGTWSRAWVDEAIARL